MAKMVRKHLSRKYVVQEEELLEKIADSSERSEPDCLSPVIHQNWVGVNGPGVLIRVISPAVETSVFDDDEVCEANSWW